MLDIILMSLPSATLGHLLIYTAWRGACVACFTWNFGIILLVDITEPPPTDPPETYFVVPGIGDLPAVYQGMSNEQVYNDAIDLLLAFILMPLLSATLGRCLCCMFHVKPS